MTSETIASIAPAYEDAYARVYHGDCLDVMKTLDSDSIDAIVTDPPYGLTDIPTAKARRALDEWLSGNDAFVPDGKGFMNKRWDKFVPPPAVWREAYRLLRPGGLMVCFAGSRTIDLMTLSIRLGGFEILDSVGWFYGTGMPKSMNVAKAIDKQAGYVGDVIGTEQVDTGMQGGQLHAGRGRNIETREVRDLSPQARAWDGWFTSLKPAHEPMILARKEGASLVERLPAFNYQSKAKSSERPSYLTDEGDEVEHSTVKPLPLIRFCLDNVAPRQGLVLDMFLGSGTTCEAAKMDNLNSIGIELEDIHIPLIRERLAGRDTWAGGLFD